MEGKNQPSGGKPQSRSQFIFLLL